MRRPSFRRLFRFPTRGRDDVARDVDEEIAFHLEMRAAELEREGVAPAEAAERARREFGDVERARRALRDADRRGEDGRRRARWWSELRRDAAFALRGLRREPVFAVVAVLTLGVGIGAATAMFSVVDEVLLRPLPLAHEDRAVLVHKELRDDEGLVPFAYPDFTAFAERSRTLEAVAGVQYDGAWPWTLLQDDGGAVPVTGAMVSGEYFRVLGVRPVLGTMPTAAHDVPGEPVAVIGHGLWMRQFGGDPAVVGRTLQTGLGPVTVVAVAPPGFEFPRGAELWVPVALPAEVAASRGFAGFSLVGRLRPGATAEQARAEVQAFQRGREPLYLPSEPRSQRAVVRSFTDAVVGDARPALYVLSAAVGLVLGMAAVNVAGLLLIRAGRRGRELALRAALGAGRGRLARQLLTESAVLAALGGAVGVALAWTALRVLPAVAPADLPRVEGVSLDPRALAFALGAAALVALVSGMAPVLWSSRARLAQSLRAGGRATPEGKGARRGKQALVAGQVAVALVVVAGAGLLGRSLQRLQSVEMGFDADRLSVVSFALPREMGAPGNPARMRFFTALAERVRAAPGVEGATPVMLTPFSGEGGWDARYATEGQGSLEAASNPALNLEAVAPEYFRTMGATILRGRGFTEADREGAVPVAVVDDALARRAWPGEDPLGKRIKLGAAESEEPWRTVVGVVAPLRYRDLRDAPPGIYLPFAQAPTGPQFLVVRTAGSGDGVAATVRAAAAELDPAVRVVEASTLLRLLAGPLARPRFQALLLGALAAVSLGLAALGLYGLMASLVAQRSREIGIRMALGARAAAVRGWVLRQGLALAAVGAAAGLALSLAAARGLSSLLFEVAPTDPATYAGVVAVLTGAVLLASWLPARRATRVDPVEVLRGD